MFASAAASYGQGARVEVGADGQVRRLSQVMKYKILIQDDKPAGQVVDFVLSDGGCIDYMVATYEDQYYVIPYSAAQVRYDDSVVFVDLAPARFEQVQFFAADNWPNFYAPAYQKQVFTSFGVDVIRRDGDATFRRDRDDDDDADDRRDRRQDRRDERRDRDDNDRPRAKDRDRDRDEDVDNKDRPDAPDRDQPKSTPKSKSEPAAPKSDPKTPKADPEKTPKGDPEKTPKAEPKTPKSPNVNPPKPDAGNPKPLPKNPAPKNPAPKKPETPKEPK
jgi:hypothetical protein